MIAANELRIGNLVNKSLKSGNGRTITDKIYCRDIVKIFENTGSFNYEPIPLTGEWLVKFPEWFRIFILEGYANVPTPNGFIDVEYVHTAQNLYFALTGEELVCK